MNSRVTIYRLKIDMAATAAGLFITEADALEIFKDGRAIALVAEYWVAQKTGVTRYNNNYPGVDAFVRMPSGDRMHCAIRVLTKHIRFQASKFMGAGRTCTMQDLKASIRKSDRWAVVDNTDLPHITIYMFPETLLEDWIDAGELTVAGMSNDRFTALVLAERPTINQMELRV
jgi:hypothetical protein